VGVSKWGCEMQIPSFFDQLIKDAEDLGGGITIFDPNDRLVFINQYMRMRYDFMEFSEDTNFENIFWSSVSARMYTDAEIYSDPHTHLRVSRKIRKQALELKFFRPCSDGRTLLCLHRGLPNGWNCQIRVHVNDVEQPFAGFGGGPAVPKIISDQDNNLSDIREIQKLKQRNFQMRQTIDLVPFGIATVSFDGEVIDLNRRMGDILREKNGLLVRDGRLTASDNSDAIHLKGVIRKCASSEEGKGRRVALINRPRGGDPYVVAVSSGRPHGVGTERESQANCAIVFVSNTEGEGVAPTEILTALYQLTPSEARVVTEIGCGKTPDDLADETGRSIGTIRNQIKAAMAKIGLDRQVQLVRLLMKIGSIVGRN